MGLILSLISEEYKSANAELHSRNPLFGSKGYKVCTNIVESLGLKEGDTVVDYGCGKGTLGRSLKDLGIRYVGYDPAIKMFSKHPSEYPECPWKYLVCCDVLEHVEPPYLSNVLNDIKGLFTDKCFLLVSTEPSNKTLKDGRNAHLIINGSNWWADRFEEHGFNIEFISDNRKGWYGVVCTHKEHQSD